MYVPYLLSIAIRYSRREPSSNPRRTKRRRSSFSIVHTRTCTSRQMVHSSEGKFWLWAAGFWFMTCICLSFAVGMCVFSIIFLIAS